MSLNTAERVLGLSGSHALRINTPYQHGLRNLFIQVLEKDKAGKKKDLWSYE